MAALFEKDILCLEQEHRLRLSGEQERVEKEKKRESMATLGKEFEEEHQSVEKEQQRPQGASELTKMLATPEAKAITEARKNGEIQIDRLKSMLRALLPQISNCDCDEDTRNDLLKKYHMLLKVYQNLGGTGMLLKHTQLK